MSWEQPMIADLALRPAARSGALSPHRAAWPDRLLRPAAWRDRLLRLAGSRPAGASQTIARHASLRLGAAPGTRIDCLDGCVWVTIDGDRRDVIVEAGGSLVVDRRGRVLVHALEHARVRLSGPTA
jgi:hypothetical protein